MSVFTLESANGTRRVRWYALVALILVPLLLAGGVLLAVHNYSSRLSTVSAAIVNNDAGTTIDGKTVPLGRQLSAALVKGGANDVGIDGNYDWVLTDTTDAAGGLNDGRYAVVVTIPKNFSKSATSYSDAATATQATVSVKTSDSSRIADGAISTVIASAATRTFGQTLSTSYLKNIYVAFNTLHDQLGKAATGTHQLADGLTQSATGTAKLATGADSLASGTAQLTTGIGQLATGARASATGAGTFATGVKKYTDGTTSLAKGLTKLADGTSALPAQVSALASGSAGITSGVQTIAQLAASNPNMTLAELDAAFASQGSSLAQLASGSAQVSGGLTQFSDALPTITGGIAASATGAQKLSTSGTKLASGASSLATGLDKLADGVTTTQTGAKKLSTGVASYATGVHQLAAGSTKLTTGATTLADGLDTAVKQLPTYSAAERTRLADVVTTPVTTESASVSGLFTRSAVPLLMAVALLLGALATYSVIAPITRRALTSRRSSARLALFGYLPGLVIGVVQGIAVAGLAQLVLQLDVGQWFALAGISALAGASFAAVVQGVVALMRSAGRLVIALVAAVALAAGIISTAPGALLDVAGLLPTSPASVALSAVTTDVAGVGSSIAVLVFWGLIGFALSTAAILRKRAVSVRQVAELPA